MEREVRYCTTEDGVRIAHCVEGAGPPLLVVPWNFASFSLMHLVPEMDAFVRELGRGRTLIQWDVRGVGLSQRNVGDLSLPALLLDVDAVVKAVGLKKFALLGMMNGSPFAIAYAANRWRRVDRLILFSAVARPVDDVSRAQTEAFAQFARVNWELAARAMTDAQLRRHSDEVGLRTAQWFQQSVTGETAARFIESAIDLDVTPLLPRVKCPTLIIHRRDDSRYADGQQVAANIQNARFVTIEEEGNIFLGDWPPVLDTINDFLPAIEDAGARRPPAERATVRTVLFTDIVGHTAMMSRLGDDRGREVLREHETITRNVLKEHGGTEVKTMGDGFMASFGSVTKAVECAIALQRAFDERNTSRPARPEVSKERADYGRLESVEPLRVRVGLNAGEPIEEDGDLFGATVILASRIAAKADGGEILVADTVRGLCSGKGFLFADRGEFVAKGFEEPVRVYEVHWRE